jgi:2-amino-4-hydroxy-6-hydroxymethyldihydropteridine diphosphokinase
MDLDILLFGEMLCDEPGLKLPRPDLLKRPYMLGPAAEIAPALVHPTAQRTLGELWHAMLSTQAAHTMRPVDLGWSAGKTAC